MGNKTQDKTQVSTRAQTCDTHKDTDEHPSSNQCLNNAQDKTQVSTQAQTCATHEDTDEHPSSNQCLHNAQDTASKLQSDLARLEPTKT